MLIDIVAAAKDCAPYALSAYRLRNGFAESEPAAPPDAGASVRFKPSAPFPAGAFDAPGAAAAPPPLAAAPTAPSVLFASPPSVSPAPSALVSLAPSAFRAFGVGFTRAFGAFRTLLLGQFLPRLAFCLRGFCGDGAILTRRLGGRHCRRLHLLHFRDCRLGLFFRTDVYGDFAAHSVFDPVRPLLEFIGNSPGITAADRLVRLLVGADFAIAGLEVLNLPLLILVQLFAACGLFLARFGRFVHIPAFGVFRVGGKLFRSGRAAGRVFLLQFLRAAPGQAKQPIRRRRPVDSRYVGENLGEITGKRDRIGDRIAFGDALRGSGVVCAESGLRYAKHLVQPGRFADRLEGRNRTDGRNSVNHDIAWLSGMSSPYPDDIFPE